MTTEYPNRSLVSDVIFYICREQKSGPFILDEGKMRDFLSFCTSPIH